MSSNLALYSDAPGRHGLCIDRKGRASLRRAGKRERKAATHTQ